MSYYSKILIMTIITIVLSGCLANQNSDQIDLLNMGYSKEQFEIIRKRQDYEQKANFAFKHTLHTKSKTLALHLMDIERAVAIVIPLTNKSLSVLYIDMQYNIKDDTMLLINNQDYFFDSVNNELIVKLQPSYFYFLDGNRLQITLHILMQLKKGKTAFVKRKAYLSYRPMIKADIGKYSFRYIDLTTLTIDDIAPYIVTSMKQQSKFVDANSFTIQYEPKVRKIIKAVKAYKE